MSNSTLLITVRLPEGRFHGMPEWPPSPFRLFQALIAGALAGAPRAREDEIAPVYTWFEGLPPPLIAAPPARKGCRSDLWVPNNDIDAVGGDPRHVDKIRTAKRVAPRLFAPDAPLLYLWSFAGEVDEPAAAVTVMAEQLYQFGRGVDMAYASAEVISAEVADARIAAYHGAVYRPAAQGEGGMALRCPTAGSFTSLLQRHRAQRTRLRDGHLTQAPPARFRTVAYAALPIRLLFDLMEGEGRPRFARVPQTSAACLVEQVRERLQAVLTRMLDDPPLVERVVVGRGAGEPDKTRRLRIIPLPSIGFDHADRAIRRILIEVPPGCPIPAREIEWAAGAVHLGADQDGAIIDAAQPQLVRASDDGMLRHYGTGGKARPARVWRTVSPAVLPAHRPHGRAGGAERAAGDARAVHAVRQALRHAGIADDIETIGVQREPFERRGERADAFARPARLANRALDHVEIIFQTPRAGPLLIGDGRYVGLGVMAPVARSWRDMMIFGLPQPGPATDDVQLLLRAARRALMALARDSGGRVPRLFSGHEDDGAPARSGGHEHLFLAADDADSDGRINRLLVAAPWTCDRSASPKEADRERFEEVVARLGELRAGRLGVLRLTLLPTTGSADDPLLGSARVWESRTPYHSTRHARRHLNPAVTVAEDLVLECVRRGLPQPEIEILEATAGPRGGKVAARLRLHFAVSVAGPLLLGRDSHQGGGLFAAG